MKMFSLTLIAVLGAFLLGKTDPDETAPVGAVSPGSSPFTECTISNWMAGGGTTTGATVTDAMCATVAEGGTVSFTVTATTDVTPVTYTIPTQPTTTGTYTFDVDSASGAVTLTAGTLDHEADATIDIVIHAADSTTGTPATGDLTCTLTVTDVTEGVPGFSLGTSCLSFANNLPAGTALTTIAGSLASQTVAIVLTAGNTGSAFTYTPATGALVVGGSPLTTATATYTLTFTATDHASPVQTATTSLTIIIGSDCPNGAVVMAVSAYLIMATLLPFLG